MKVYEPTLEQIDKVRDKVLYFIDRNDYRGAIYHVRNTIGIGVMTAKNIVDDIYRESLGLPNPTLVSKKIDKLYDEPSSLINYIETKPESDE